MSAMKTVMITGATSGIGWACAERFAAMGYQLIICGRRTERLEALKDKLSVPVHTLSFDVRDRDKVAEAVASLPPEFQKIDVLVNNAGNAHGRDDFAGADLDDFDAMLDINVKGLLYVTKAVLPLMLKEDKGHIINIGSLAGRDVYPNGSVYCASKHAVAALTRGMQLDLNKTGIKVSEVKPGLAETEFSVVRFKGDTEKAKKVYEGFRPLLAEDVAEVIAYVACAPAHVNIANTLILPAAQADSVTVNKSL